DRRHDPSRARQLDPRVRRGQREPGALGHRQGPAQRRPDRARRPRGPGERRLEGACGRMSVLRNPALRALLIAQAVSRFGSQMTFLALPWFVLETTGSASRMGVVLAVELLPIALFGIVSGSLVARLGARRTLMLGDAARVPILAAVPLLYEAGVLSFGLLLVLVFLAGCALAPYMSAATVVIPELVGD